MADRAMRLLRVPEAGELIRRAQRRARSDDFGEAEIARPLRILLDACREEAALSLFGRAALRWDTLRFLSNLLRLRQEELRAPEILDIPIERPILIAGLPRSGTTFLHSLMAEDPDNLAPRVWQLIHPYPEIGVADRRQQRVARQLKLFGVLAPEFRRLHPIAANSPQECSEITAHVFASLRFDTTYRIPGYRRWLDVEGQREAYRFHKRFLRHLQWQAGGRGQWALKCPDHIFALPAIREVYPDARLVFVHRDPLAVLLSVARLTGVLRRPFTRHLDKIEIGREDSDRWLAAAKLMIAADEQDGFADRICHVHYADLAGDPLGTVRTIYRHFGLMLGAAAEERIGRAVATRPNGGYGARRYRFAEHGLDAARERVRFSGYVEHFRISPEPEPGAPRPAPKAAGAVARASAAPAD